MINAVRWKSEMEVLTPGEISIIHEASLHILWHTGILMPLDEKKYEKLQDLGVKVEREKKRYISRLK